MKKCFTALVALLILITGLSVTAGAATEGLVITDGVLTGYTGSDADVVVPVSVNAIAAGAFAPGSAASVTVLNGSCTIEDGAIASDITVVGYPFSSAETAAGNGGNPFVEFYGFKLTVRFLDEHGNTVSPEQQLVVEPGETFSLTPPAIKGYTPDRNPVSGTMGEQNSMVNVIYTKNPDTTPVTPPEPTQSTGWKIELPYIRYYDASIPGYLSGTIREIDGFDRTFDSNGNLQLSGEKITIGGDTYYLVNSKILQGGVVRIGDGIYCLDGDGRMIKNGKDSNGCEYDSEGRMVTTRQIIQMGDGNSYYLSENKLRKGYIYEDGVIYYFGSDYAMVKGATNVDGMKFDKNGHLTEGIKAEDLKYVYEESKTYNDEEQTPEVEVYFEGIRLTEGVHYTLEYLDNKDPGTAKIKVTGLGIVSGEHELEFEIIGKDTYTLTIRYQDDRGYDKARPHIEELKPEAKYEVKSPEIKGFKIVDESQKIIKGEMPEGDVTVTVIYEATGEATDPATDTGPDTEPADVTDTEPETEDGNGPKTVKPGSKRYNVGLFLTVLLVATLFAGLLILLIVKFKDIKAYFQGLGGKKKKDGKKGEKPVSVKADDDVKTPGKLPHAAGAAAGAAKNNAAGDMSKTIKFDIGEIMDAGTPGSEDLPTPPSVRKKTVYHFRKK